PQCGAPRAAGHEAKKERQRSRRRLGRTLAGQDIVRGLVATIGGIAFIAVGCIMSPVSDWGLGIIITAIVTNMAGLGMLARGLIRIRRCNPDDYPDSPELAND